MREGETEGEMLEAGRNTADGERGQEQMKGSEVSHQSLLCLDLTDLFSSPGDRLQQSHAPIPVQRYKAKASLSESESKVQRVICSCAFMV